MPGSIKNGGVWKSATGLYIKVNGTWRTVTSGFIKVGGQWKQWFASKIQDAFNRTSTAAGLGTSDSGQAWESTSGNWRINGSNQAQSDDSASSYPLASANLGNTDVKVQADVSGGVGVAFWVSSAGSWWAAVPRYTTYITSSSSTVCDQGLATCSGAGCNPSGSCCSSISTSQSNNCDSGLAQSTSNPPAGNCCSGVWQSGGGSSCSGGYVSSSSNPPAGNCCSSVSQSTTPGSCSQGLVSGSSNPPAGNCCSGVSQSGGGQTYVCNQGYTNVDPPFSGCCSSADSVNVNTYSSPACATAGQCSGTISTGGTTNYYVIDKYINGGTSGPQDSCANYGWTSTSCGNCGVCNQYLLCCKETTAGSTITCSCTSTTLYYCYTSGSWVPNPTTYSCYTAYSASTTSYSCYTSYVPNPTYYNCYTSYTLSTTRSCYTGTRTIYNSTTNYKSELVILSSVSGTVVSAAAGTISDNTSGFTSVGSIYVQTGGNAISAYAYSGSNLGGSQLGSTLNHTASNPTKGTSVGIIKSPSSGSQGSTADNFLATI